MAKSISLGTMIRSLDEEKLNRFIDEVSSAIDRFLDMGSKLEMSEDPWVNYLIQRTNGGYGFCDVKTPANHYLKLALSPYIGSLECTNTGPFLRWIRQVILGQSSRDVVTASVVYFKNCKAKHVIRDLSAL